MSTASSPYDTAAAVLMGGGSRRMGSPKQHVEIDGVPMGQRVITIARDSGFHVVISGPNEAMPGMPHIADLATHAEHGPLAGIEAVLASGLAARWLILPCDMPRLTAASLTQLLALHVDIAAFADPTNHTTPLQLPLLIREAMLDPISRYLDSGRRSIGGWLAEHTITLAPPLESSEAENINSL